MVKPAIPEAVAVPGGLELAGAQTGDAVEQVVPPPSPEEDDVAPLQLRWIAGFHHYPVPPVAEEGPHAHACYSKRCRFAFVKDLFHDGKQRLRRDRLYIACRSLLEIFLTYFFHSYLQK